jgi:hypothetical protein
MSLAYYVPASVDISTFFDGKNDEFSNHDIIYKPVLPAETVLQQDHGEHSAFGLYLRNLSTSGSRVLTGTK